jgi:hypothetical protein
VRRIIDVHVHLYPEKRLGGLMRWVHRGMPDHPVPVEITVPQVINDLREAGVVKFLAAVFPLAPGEAQELNRFNALLARSIPEMIPLGTVHQDDADPEGIAREALCSLGLKGIKLHPMMMRMEINDPRMARVFALAQEMGLPFLLHTGFEEGYGRNTPCEEWEKLFRSFPRLTFLLVHMFFPDLPLGFALLDRFENIFLDCTNVFGMYGWPEGPLPFGISRPCWGKETFISAIEANASRVLFGSDHPAGTGTMRKIVEQVETFGLSKETVERILYRNSHHLLNRLGLE